MFPRKSRKLLGPDKPFLKLRFAYSVKPVFSYVVKGIKIETTAKFRASRCLCFEDTKRIMSLEMRPKSFGAFEKRAPGPSCGIVLFSGSFTIHCLRRTKSLWSYPVNSSTHPLNNWGRMKASIKKGPNTQLIDLN